MKALYELNGTYFVTSQQRVNDTGGILQNLASGSSYTIRLVSVNAEGYSIASTEVEVRTRPLQMLVNLTAPKDVTGNFIIISILSTALERLWLVASIHNLYVQSISVY